MGELFMQLSYWSWFIMALLLVILEVFVPGTFFLWMGISAGVVGVVLMALPDLSWQLQLSLFALLSVGSILFWFKLFKRRPIESDEPLLNRRGEQQVGRRYRLETPIENGRGKVRVGDSLWSVEGEDRPAGEVVTVVSVSGSILRVE